MSLRVKDTLIKSDRIKEVKAFFLLFISISDTVYFWGISMVAILAQIICGLTFLGFWFNHNMLPLGKKDGNRQYDSYEKSQRLADMAR
jgi:hypothetical protein